MPLEGKGHVALAAPPAQGVAELLAAHINAAKGQDVRT